jgi:hypothetical protein
VHHVFILVGPVMRVVASIVQHTHSIGGVPDTFFGGRRVQIATLAVRDRIPAAYAKGEIVAAGGLMSHGTNIADLPSRKSCWPPPTR